MLQHKVMSSCAIHKIHQTIKYGTLELELKSFFIIFLRTVRVPFSLQHKPKDPGPNNCSLVDWAWFTAAKGAV